MAHLTKERQKEIDSFIDSVKLNTGLSYPENGLIDIAKALEIGVYEVDLSKFPDVNGVIQYRSNEIGGQKNSRIYINKNHTPEKKTFTLAHELGHYFLHNGKDKLRIDRFDYTKDTQESLEETEANYFAAVLLVPTEKLSKLLALTDGRDLHAIASYFGVSKPVIENRIKWLKMNQ